MAGRNGGQFYGAWLAGISQIKSELTGIDKLKAGLALGGLGPVPPALLLGYRPDGNGHAIVSFGNPDKSAITVTCVPGVGSGLASTGQGDCGRAAQLWLAAHADRPGASLASVYWLDYNSPQLTSAGATQIPRTGDAVAGGQALAGFQSGLAAAHAAGVPDRTVLLGHSYGSLVVGEAMTRDGVRAADVIFVGSPGVGVDQAGLLGIPPGHVWAGANVNDPISRLGWFGTDPASPGFGGKVFAANVDPGEPSRYDPGYFLGAHAHSTYWDRRSESLYNLGKIVTGQYDQVKLAPQPHLPAPAALPPALPAPPPVPGHLPSPVSQPMPGSVAR